MSGEENNKNKTVSFRMSEDVYGDLADLDISMSKLYRGMTDLYLEDSFFREGVNAILEGGEKNFAEFSMSRLESSAQDFAEELLEVHERPIDAADLKEPLVSYALNAAAGYRTGTYDAVEKVREVDEPIGEGLERATDRFPHQYWDEALE
ncbi:MAG: hypothetical protein ACI977_000508 [Candidatus Nanohaloarchaea archaeon]|jgi:hypothetical protein